MSQHTWIGPLDTFEVKSQPIDVTSDHRPDVRWRFVDAAGHEHRWFTGDQPATTYDPRLSYHVPTLTLVIDGFDEDGGEFGHQECRECGEHVKPGFTADTNRVYIAGPASHYINNTRVTEAEFMARFEDAQKLARRMLDLPSSRALLNGPQGDRP